MTNKKVLIGVGTFMTVGGYVLVIRRLKKQIKVCEERISKAKELNEFLNTIQKKFEEGNRLNKEDKKTMDQLINNLK